MRSRSHGRPLARWSLSETGLNCWTTHTSWMPGVVAVAEREVDQPVRAGERHGGLGALAGEQLEPAARASGEDRRRACASGPCRAGTRSRARLSADRARSLRSRADAARRIPLLARADPAEPHARGGPPRRARGLRGGDVVRPLSSPWSARQGESGFAWSFLGAALATTELTFGVVNAPGQRYHPVIIAQAIASLNEMFPRRLWAALGTGEASNEHVTGERWPPKAERNARLLECVEVMRALFAGEEVTHQRPRRRRPRAAVDAARRAARAHRARRSASRRRRWVGGWADGLVTVNQPLEKLRRDARRLSRGRRRGQAHGAAGPRVVGAERGGGAAHRPRPVAHARLRAAAELGHRDGRAVRPGRHARAAGGRARRRARLRRPRAPRRVAAASSPRSASTRSTCTTSARSRARSSTPSPSTCCRSCGDRRCASTRPATCGGRTRSSSASTSRPTSTPTATASATSAGSPARSTTSPGSA